MSKILPISRHRSGKITMRDLSPEPSLRFILGNDDSGQTPLIKALIRRRLEQEEMSGASAASRFIFYGRDQPPGHFDEIEGRQWGEDISLLDSDIFCTYQTFLAEYPETYKGSGGTSDLTMPFMANAKKESVVFDATRRRFNLFSSDFTEDAWMSSQMLTPGKSVTAARAAAAAATDADGKETAPLSPVPPPHPHSSVAEDSEWTAVEHLAFRILSDLRVLSEKHSSTPVVLILDRVLNLLAAESAAAAAAAAGGNGRLNEMTQGIFGLLLQMTGQQNLEIWISISNQFFAESTLDRFFRVFFQIPAGETFESFVKFLGEKKAEIILLPSFYHRFGGEYKKLFAVPAAAKPKIIPFVAPRLTPDMIIDNFGEIRQFVQRTHDYMFVSPDQMRACAAPKHSRLFGSGWGKQ